MSKTAKCYCQHCQDVREEAAVLRGVQSIPGTLSLQIHTSKGSPTATLNYEMDERQAREVIDALNNMIGYIRGTIGEHESAVEPGLRPCLPDVKADV